MSGELLIDVGSAKCTAILDSIRRTMGCWPYIVSVAKPENCVTSSNPESVKMNICGIRST